MDEGDWNRRIKCREMYKRGTMETTHGKTAKIKAHLGGSIETLYMDIYESNLNKFAKIGGGGGTN